MNSAIVFAQLGMVGHLVDEAKLAPDVSCRLWGCEIADSIQALGERFNGSVRHPDTSMELVWVQHNA